MFGAEREAASSAQVKTLEESLAQKEATLREKDADLRESILSVQTMQRDHREEVTRVGEEDVACGDV